VDDETAGAYHRAWGWIMQTGKLTGTGVVMPANIRGGSSHLARAAATSPLLATIGSMEDGEQACGPY
jgi:hypothetical protein